MGKTEREDKTTKVRNISGEIRRKLKSLRKNSKKILNVHTEKKTEIMSSNAHPVFLLYKKYTSLNSMKNYIFFLYYFARS